MNWRGWIWGLLLAFLTGSITAVNTIGQFPNATEYQLFLVTYPVIVGSILAFLMKSPFPGSKGVNNVPLPPTK